MEALVLDKDLRGSARARVKARFAAPDGRGGGGGGVKTTRLERVCVAHEPLNLGGFAESPAGAAARTRPIAANEAVVGADVIVEFDKGRWYRGRVTAAPAEQGSKRGLRV